MLKRRTFFTTLPFENAQKTPYSFWYKLFGDICIEDDAEEMKKVSWDNRVSVIMVPTKEEYIEVNIHRDLWCNSDDYKEFKKEYAAEIKRIMREKSMNMEEATKVIKKNDYYASLNEASLQ